MIKVGFVFSFEDQSWLGGINYFHNLLEAVYRLPERRLDPVIITGRRTSSTLLTGFPPCPVVRSALFDRWHPLWISRKAVTKAAGFDLALEGLCRRLGVQVLSHSGYLRPGSSIKTTGWISDFQHKHLPEWFDDRERANRDRIFSRTCRFCDAVIVSSQAAANDLVASHPLAAAKARVLSFTASMSQGPQPADLESIRTAHRLPEKFFHLPNQFWIHKNHRVVIDALALLRKRGEQVRVVATGNTRDHRHPRYFHSLMEAVRSAGLGPDFQVLGIVPYAQVRALMESAVAVINPSLFEGWSSTVEEAKSLGKQVVLSSIPVHVEQAPPRGSYFPAGDALALADLLWKIWSEYDAEADRREMARAASTLEERVRAFGRAYQAIVLDAAG